MDGLRITLQYFGYFCNDYILYYRIYLYTSIIYQKTDLVQLNHFHTTDIAHILGDSLASVLMMSRFTL